MLWLVKKYKVYLENWMVKRWENNFSEKLLHLKKNTIYKYNHFMFLKQNKGRGHEFHLFVPLVLWICQLPITPLSETSSWVRHILRRPTWYGLRVRTDKILPYFLVQIISTCPSTLLDNIGMLNWIQIF